MKNIYLVLTALFAMNMTSAVFANEPTSENEVATAEAAAEETAANETENQATEENA